MEKAVLQAANGEESEHNGSGGPGGPNAPSCHRAERRCVACGRLGAP